jgi:hypothetical protein
MATLVVYEPTRNGDSKTYQTLTSGGDQVPNDGKTVLHFKNTSGGSITVTAASARPCDQGSTHNETIVVAATTGDEIAGPFGPSRFNDASNMLQLTYSTNPPTGLTCAPVRVNPAT